MIRKGFKEYCGLIFEVDHAKALCNQDDPGEHHPGNLQLLIPSTNRAKGAKNWKRLSWEEQEQYIRLQKEASSVLNSFDEEMEKVFNLLLQRLQVIYSI